MKTRRLVPGPESGVRMANLAGAHYLSRMPPETLGAALAFGTTLCWCLSALAFEAASRRAGSVPVNLLRLIVAFLMLTAARRIAGGPFWPSDATPHQWKWLLFSGLIGFFVGDVTLFRAFVLLGARLATLIACTAPIFTLAAERLTLPNTPVGALPLLGVLVTVAGVAWVVLERRVDGPAGQTHPAGVLLALAGAAGQGVGAVLTAKAFEPAPYDAFAAGQIRMLAGIAAFAAFALLTRRVRATLATLRDGPALGFLSLGAFWGPFLGVSLFIQSLQYIPSSTTQTITSLVPVFIIPFAIFVRKERVSPRAILGACVAVAGVWLLLHTTPRGRL